jgi:hypothetical protein
MGWGIENVVWVSDRGIFTNSKIKELVKPIEGLDYITGLTKPQIRKREHLTFVISRNA